LVEVKRGGQWPPLLLFAFVEVGSTRELLLLWERVQPESLRFLGRVYPASFWLQSEPAVAAIKGFARLRASVV